MDTTAYDFSFEDTRGAPMPLSAYRGKVLLVVNTATKCGFSMQYGPLRELQQKYGPKGLQVIGVPSNDFNQEPLTGDELASHCQVKFLTNFPVTARTRVKGKDAHAFYRWAHGKSGYFGRPKYNFHKYLIGRNGEFIGWYSALTSPARRKLVRQIEYALGL